MCDVIVSKDSLFRLTLSNLSNLVDCLLAWSVVCVRVCVRCKRETSVVVRRG